MQINIIVIICILLFIIAFIAIIIYQKRNTIAIKEPMEGSEFENYCAALLEDIGFEEINQTPISRDYGCDILAKKDGVSYGIQCKSYSTPVGISAVQQAYAGKDYYDCMVGVVMTNSSFTDPAINMANKLKVLLWDDEKLKQMEHLYILQ